MTECVNQEVEARMAPMVDRLAAAERAIDQLRDRQVDDHTHIVGAAGMLMGLGHPDFDNSD